MTGVARKDGVGGWRKPHVGTLWCPALQLAVPGRAE